MKSVLQFRIEKDVLNQFKEYCISKDTTMSKVLIDYITTILSENAEILPGGEKNSVGRTALTKLFHCPYCGSDITGKSESGRLNHLQNCKNNQNR